MLEETNYIPTEKYAKAPELLDQARRIGEKFDLYPKTYFHTEANKFTWDEEASRWIIETNRGDKIRARFAASASGPLNMPKLPGVEGIEKFKGHSFHTSRWDYEYTGGTLHGNLDKLGDKRVGFIGTGATAIQAVPHLGKGVQGGENGRLYVFQRTPSSVSRRDNRPTDPNWARSLKDGWYEHRQENFLRVMFGSQEEDLVSDGWTSFSRWLKDRGLKRSPNLFAEYGALLEIADMQNMERIRARCDDVVKDEATAAALKPWYRQFCKRPCFHDEYLDTYNLSNVTLVDTDGKGIERITEKGIIAGGKEYELDCIVYGTGFEVGTSYQRRSNFEIYGRNGLSLADKWAEGPTTLHGFFVREFPNYFVVSTLHSGYAANFVHMLGRQAKHIAWIIKTAKERDIKIIETTPQAEESWTDEIVNGLGMRRNLDVQRDCTPGYYNLEGQITSNLKTKRSGNYAPGPLAFCKLMEDWRAKGDMEGLELTTDATAWKKETNGVNGANGTNGTHAENGTNDLNGHLTNGESNGQSAATNGQTVEGSLLAEAKPVEEPTALEVKPVEAPIIVDAKSPEELINGHANDGPLVLNGADKAVDGPKVNGEAKEEPTLAKSEEFKVSNGGAIGEINVLKVNGP
jgi:cyclohexanone monooxygenase